MSVTSGTTSWNETRDGIIARALRIIGAFGQGETIPTQATTDGAEALNALIKEWQTDGMPLWKRTTSIVTYTTGASSYTIGIGSTTNSVAPLKVYQAFNRDTVASPNTDMPMILVSNFDYNLLSPKASTGTPNQVFYDPPKAAVSGTSSINMQGTVTVYPTPDANSITRYRLYLIGYGPYEDAGTVGTEVPDFPTYWNNALTWGLAADLAYEYGVGITQRAQLEKKSEQKKQAALSFGTEEGSLYLRPTQTWDYNG